MIKPCKYCNRDIKCEYNSCDDFHQCRYATDCNKNEWKPRFSGKTHTLFKYRPLGAPYNNMDWDQDCSKCSRCDIIWTNLYMRNASERDWLCEARNESR